MTSQTKKLAAMALGSLLVVLTAGTGSGQRLPRRSARGSSGRWCSSLRVIDGMGGFFCTLPAGRYQVGDYGRRGQLSSANLVDGEACRAAGVRTRASQSRNVTLRYSRHEEFRAGARFALNEIEEWLPNGQIEGGSNTTLEFTVSMAGVHVETLQDLTAAVRGAGSADQNNCLASLCRSGNRVVTETVVGTPSFRIRRADGGALDLSLGWRVVGVEARWRVEQNREILITSTEPLTLGHRWVDASDVVGDLCHSCTIPIDYTGTGVAAGIPVQCAHLNTACPIVATLESAQVTLNRSGCFVPSHADARVTLSVNGRSHDGSVAGNETSAPITSSPGTLRVELPPGNSSVTGSVDVTSGGAFCSGGGGGARGSWPVTRVTGTVRIRSECAAATTPQ